MAQTQTLYPNSHNNQRTVFILPDGASIIPGSLRLAQFSWTVPITAGLAGARDQLTYDRDVGSAAIIQRITLEANGQTLEVVENAYNLFGLAQVMRTNVGVQADSMSALAGSSSAASTQYGTISASQPLVLYKDNPVALGTETLIRLSDACGLLAQPAGVLLRLPRLTVSIDYVASDATANAVVGSYADPGPNVGSPTVQRPVLLFDTVELPSSQGFSHGEKHEKAKEKTEITYFSPIRDLFVVSGGAGTLTLNSVANAFDGRYIDKVICMTKASLAMNKAYSIPMLNEQFAVLLNDESLFPRPIDNYATKALMLLDAVGDVAVAVPPGGAWPLCNSAINLTNQYDAEAFQCGFDNINPTAATTQTRWSYLGFRVNEMVQKMQFAFQFPADATRGNAAINIEVYGWALRQLMYDPATQAMQVS